MIRYHFNEKEKLFLDIFCQSEDPDMLSLGGIIMDEEAYPAEGSRRSCWIWPAPPGMRRNG